MKKSKIILPIVSLATLGTVAAPLMSLTSCGNTKADDTVEIVNKYTKFYNNYQAGDLKDKIYRTAEIGTNVVCNWTNDGTTVTATQIAYDPVLDQLIITDDTATNQIQFNVFSTPEGFRDLLKTYELMSTSHTYDVKEDEIKFEFKQETKVIFSITFNKNGYITHYLKDKVEATFTLKDPTSTRLLDLDKFLIAYDKLGKFYRAQRTIYITNDVNNKLSGVLKVQGKGDVNLQSVDFNYSKNYQTGKFDETYSAVSISIDGTYTAIATKLAQLAVQGFTDFEFSFDNWETNGVSFTATDASSNEVKMSWNKDGYLTYDKEGTGASAYEITLTYTANPTGVRPIPPGAK